MSIIETVYVNKAELTDEEVWLRAYCACLSNSQTIKTCVGDAEICLEEFNKKFRFKHD